MFFAVYCPIYCRNYGYNYSILRTAFFSIMMYSVGFELVRVIEEKEKFYQVTIYLIACGMALYSALSFFLIIQEKCCRQ